MKKRLSACLIVLLTSLPALAADPVLQDARQRFLHGNYDEAQELYERVAKDASDPAKHVTALLGISRVQQSKGEYTKALEGIDAACKAVPKNADLHARRAELLYLAGRWDEALQAAEAALAQDGQHFLARWVRAEVYRDRGDLAKAADEYVWFVRTYSARSEKDNDIKDPDQLLLVGLAGCEHARWKHLPDQYAFILNDVYGDALKYDKDFWPAEYEAGRLLLDKYNRGEALDAFDKALQINPNAALALVGKGEAALQKLDYKDADTFAARALKINPNLPAALRLRAEVHLAGHDFKAAVADLEKARTVNPRDEITLGQLAACLRAENKQSEFDALVKEVEKFDSKPARFYTEVAEHVELRHRFDEAEQLYKKAADLRPKEPAAQNSLGLLYMRVGREAEARKILEKAFETDPFNVRVSNNLKVLRHLDKYETTRTAHFELRFDPKTDKALARYLSDYLETTYLELADKFQYRPKGPLLFEVFDSHEMFSGRVISLPDLHTIGASTGRIVAMASPRARGIAKPFNWARVVRHELVHIFNLEQTHFLCPHWLTEGLATENEGFPRPPEWNELLIERVPAGNVRNLDDIDMGFIRPKTPLDWYQAYCQSQLYVDYLRQKYGAKSIGELLAAYGEGLSTDAAIKKVCKVEKAEFEKGYRAYLDEIVKGLRGKRPVKVLSFKEMKAAHEKDPNDLDMSARLAEAYLARSERTEARKLADAVLEKNAKHPLASYVKASLLMAAGEQDKARELLEAAVNENDPEPKVLQLLAKLYFNDKKPDQAARLYELGRRAQPYDKKWLEGLARFYSQSGDKEKQISVLKDLVPLDADDLDNRRRLANLLLETKQPEQAERYARQALEIDLLDPEAVDVYYRALFAQNKDAEVKRMREIQAK